MSENVILVNLHKDYVLSFSGISFINDLLVELDHICNVLIWLIVAFNSIRLTGLITDEV
jgi:hypothetical protein